MNRIERVKSLEAFLNEYSLSIQQTRKATERLDKCQKQYLRLRKYYGSELFLQDLNASNQGKKRNKRY